MLARAQQRIADHGVVSEMAALVQPGGVVG